MRSAGLQSPDRWSLCRPLLEGPPQTGGLLKTGTLVARACPLLPPAHHFLSVIVTPTGWDQLSSAGAALTRSSARELPENDAELDPLQQAVGTQHHHGDDQSCPLVPQCEPKDGEGEGSRTNK